VAEQRYRNVATRAAADDEWEQLDAGTPQSIRPAKVTSVGLHQFVSQRTAMAYPNEPHRLNWGT
jgi:hypothetical protein